MSNALFFSRDTKTFIKIGAAIWEVPILAGYSFSQATNLTEISLNEMSNSSGDSRRGMKTLNESLAPAEWSFSTYMRPFLSSGTGIDTGFHHSVEEPLWALMNGDAAYTSPKFTTGFTYEDSSGDDNTVIDFLSSNKTELGTCELIFVISGEDCDSDEDLVYTMTNAVVNEATINFDVEGIASIQWSGFASEIQDGGSVPVATVDEAVESTSNFIRNRLTSCSLIAADTTAYPGNGGDGVYDVAITGGSVTISNNISFLTPEVLGIVNTPIGHVTGTRSVTGNFTAYLGLNDTNNSTGDLLAQVAENKTDLNNSFELIFKLGADTIPSVTLTMPTTHLEIPTHVIEDVIGVDVSFYAQPSCLDLADELTVTYEGTTY